jgi:hypothetical protein
VYCVRERTGSQIPIRVVCNRQKLSSAVSDSKTCYFRLNDKTASWEFHQYYQNCSVNYVSFIYYFQYKYNAASSVLNAIHSQINAQKPCCNNCSKHLTTHFVSWHWMEAKWDLRLSTKWLKLVKWIRLVQEVQKIKFNKSFIRAIIMNFIGKAW